VRRQQESGREGGRETAIGKREVLGTRISDEVTFHRPGPEQDGSKQQAARPEGISVDRQRCRTRGAAGCEDG
jgi:hypothetical protein